LLQAVVEHPSQSLSNILKIKTPLNDGAPHHPPYMPDMNERGFTAVFGKISVIIKKQSDL